MRTWKIYTLLRRKIMPRIWIRFKGDFYAVNYDGYKTLSAVMRDYNIKRSEIKEWWLDNN
jgi:hypothetical protein